MTATTLRTCASCGIDLSTSKRMKDVRAFLYYCHPCWAARASGARQGVPPEERVEAAGSHQQPTDALKRRRVAGISVLLGMAGLVILGVTIGVSAHHRASLLAKSSAAPAVATGKTGSESSAPAADHTARVPEPNSDRLGNGKRAPVPAPATAVTPVSLGASSAAPRNTPLDLLGSLELRTASVSGDWGRTNAGVRSPTHKPGSPEKLRLFNHPGDEYDFSVSFVPEGPTPTVALVLCRGDTAFVWNMNSNCCGFGSVNHRPSHRNRSTAQIKIAPGSAVTAIVKVRHDSVSAFMDGKLVSELKTDYSDLSLDPGWSLGAAGLIGVAVTCPVEIGSASITHVDVQRPKPAPVPAPALPPAIAAAPPPPVVDKQLSEDDVQLLNAASSTRFYNGELVDQRAAVPASFLAARANDPRSKLADLVLISHRLSGTVSNLSAEERNRLRRLPDMLYEEAIKSLFEGVPGGGGQTFSEFRQGPGWVFEAWADRMRTDEIARTMASAGACQTNVIMAGTVEQIYPPRLGSATLDAEDLTFTPIRRLEGDELKQGGKQWAKGGVGARGVAVEYGGKTPLTHVLVVVRLKTTGATVALTEDEQRILQLNGAFGFGDKNADVAKLMMCQKLLGSMPLAGMTYLPALKRDDRLQLVLPDVTARDRFVEHTVAIYCDQGRMDERLARLEEVSIPVNLSTAESDRRLALAKVLVHNRSYKTARLRLTQILDEYPNSDAAVEAKSLLASIKDR